MQNRTDSFDALEAPMGSAGKATGLRGRPPKRRRRRLAAAAMLALAMVFGSFALGAPAADASTTTITGITLTNCADGDCAIFAADHVVRESAGSANPDGTYNLRIRGCSRTGRTCHVRSWAMTMRYTDGELTIGTARLTSHTAENCGDFGVMD